MIYYILLYTRIDEFLKSKPLDDLLRKKNLLPKGEQI